MKKALIPIILSLFAAPISAQQQICLTPLEKEIVLQLNSKRKAAGLSEVNISPSLMLTANKNVEEIVTENYLSYSPEQLTHYKSETAQIRYLSNNSSDAAQIVSSLSYESQYTNHHKILLSKEEFAGKAWKAVGICVRNNTIVILFGLGAEKADKIATCDEGPFFGAEPLPPSPTFPTLEVFVPEEAFFSAWSIDANGKKHDYDPIYLSSHIEAGTNLRIPLEEAKAQSFEIVIGPAKAPIVPQEAALFHIEASETGDIKKPALVFKGNSIAEIEAYLKNHKIDEKSSNDGNGYTLLHRAVLQDNIEAVTYLLGKGANINILSNDKEAPISFCRSDAMFKLLMTKNPDLKIINVDGADILQSFAFNGVLDGVKYMVEKGGANVNRQTQKGETALYSAVFNKHAAVTEYLLSKGAKQVVSWGRTPIYESIAKGDLVITKLLVKYGANLSVVDEEGYTPLKYAQLFEKEHPEIVNYLKSVGAK